MGSSGGDPLKWAMLGWGGHSLDPPLNGGYCWGGGVISRLLGDPNECPPNVLLLGGGEPKDDPPLNMGGGGVNTRAHPPVLTPPTPPFRTPPFSLSTNGRGAPPSGGGI